MKTIKQQNKFDEQLFRRYKKALEGLTVGGSEYYNNPKRCAEYVRSRLDGHVKTIKRLIKERNDSRNKNK